MSRHDPDEMLAHFAGDMRKHIALPWKIDTKHRARQHLRHRAFGHDLVFLWHSLNILLTSVSLNPARPIRDLIGPVQAKRPVSIRRVPDVPTMRQFADVFLPL